MFYKILIKCAAKSRKAYFSGHVACVRENLLKKVREKEILGNMGVDESTICKMTFKNGVKYQIILSLSLP
jgi:hypothetical protein